MIKLLGLIGLVAMLVLGALLLDELRKIARRLGSLAEASWRIRDELSATNKRQENGEKLIPPQK